MKTFEILHDKLVVAVKNLRKNEAEILNLLALAEKDKAFVEFFGHSSLYSYCVKELKLTEAETYNYLALFRKAKEVPELRQTIESGKVSVSKLRHVCPVITKDNHKEWIERALTQTNRELISEVAKVSPYTKKREVVRPAGGGVQRLSFDVSEEMMNVLLRLKEVLRVDDLSEVIEIAAKETLKRKDPVKKAQRAIGRATKNLDQTVFGVGSDISQGAEELVEPVLKQAHDFGKDTEDTGLVPVVKQGQASDLSPDLVAKTEPVLEQATNPDPMPVAKNKATHKRKPLPQALIHAIHLRDKGQCCYVGRKNLRCDSRYRVEIHHVTPKSFGGRDEYENLVTLCHEHHKMVHERVWGQKY